GGWERPPSLPPPAVTRHLRTILVLAVLAATAAAFVVTEDLKLEPDPIARPRIDPTVSPVCQCENQAARIAFRLRGEDVLTLTIVDANGKVVRTLLREARFQPGNHQFGWDGRDQAGRIVPDGRYRPRVELQRVNRTIDFARRITVDTKSPSIRVVHVTRRMLSPDGDGRGDAITIRYRASEPSNVVLLVNGRRQIRTRLRSEGAIRWAPGRLRPGLERLQLVAADAAGNRRAAQPFYVRVRYLEATPTRLRPPRRRLTTAGTAPVSPPYTGRTARRTGPPRRHPPRLRAPAEPGR